MGRLLTFEAAGRFVDTYRQVPTLTHTADQPAFVLLGQSDRPMSDRPMSATPNAVSGPTIHQLIRVLTGRSPVLELAQDHDASVVTVNHPRRAPRCSTRPSALPGGPNLTGKSTSS
jgi:hypothetical protein